MPHKTAPADTPPVEAPKRMTLSQVVELLLSRGSAERSYVTISRNAKGDTQVEVKVQTGEYGDVQTVEAAEAKALEVYERLSAKFAPPEAREQTTVELSRNAKGDTQISVQVRSGDDGDVRTVEQAGSAALDLYDRVRRQYPMADGRTAKPGTVAE